jgi:hypothetical protein
MMCRTNRLAQSSAKHKALAIAGTARRDEMAMAREFSTKISLQRKPSILDELPDRESPTNRLMLEVLD